MKWILNLACVNGLMAGLLYPLIAIGAGLPMNWLYEGGFLLAGLGSLYLLYKYRKSL